MNFVPAINLLYPRRCPVCQEIVTPNRENPLICPECSRQLPYITGARCMKCGKGLWKGEQEYCGDCQRIPKHYVQGFPVFYYAEPLKKGVAAFKYHNRREYADFYSEAIWNRYGMEFSRIHFDGILPIPIHRHKRQIRGYNQAELIARRLSRKMQVPCYNRQLTRNVDTLPQKELNDKERLRNLKKAFHFAGKGVKLNKVLLVDDIYTTGATIEACTEILHQAGVAQVYFTSICIGKGMDDFSSR